MPDRSPRAVVRDFARVSPPLFAATLAGLALLAVSLVGLAVDPRTIAGAPAWLKPAKFGISIAIYCATFAWLFSYLRETWPRLVRATGWIIAIAFLVEIVAIGGQAARGTMSHFNIAAPIDQLAFNAMGTFIGIMWIASLVITILLFRTPIADAAMGRAIRSGLVIMLLGSVLSAAFMLRPRPEQLAELSKPDGARILGAHTVGAPDGGRGLPVTNWSTEHGDLRVAHFVSLHAIQILPILAALLAFSGRPATVEARERAVGVAGWLLAALVVLLTWQAMRGESVVAPGRDTVILFAVWLAVSMVAVYRAATDGGQALHAAR